MPQVTDSGRKKDPAWLEVAELKEAESGAVSKNKVSCNYCKAVISKKIERIKAHLGKCDKRKTPSEEESLLSEIGELTSPRAHSSSCSTQPSRSESRASVTSSASDSRPNTPFKRMRSTSMDQFIVKTSNEDTQRLNKQVGAG